MKKFVACSAVVCAALILCSGCANNATADYSTKSKTFFSMDTSATLVITQKKSDSAFEENFTSLCAGVENKLTDIENSISAHKEVSYIYAFNQAQAGATVEIDKTAYALLSMAMDIYEKTDGYYNPAVYYSVYDYGFYGQYGSMTEEDLPTDETVAAYVSLSSHFGEIELTENDGRYYAKKPAYTAEINGKTLSLKIDLGGIGKGYAVDVINSILEEYGYGYGFFNFGSSSIAIKKHYESVDYSLNFLAPRSKTGGSYLVTKIKDSCVSTSGDYEAYYELDGVRYCHIINPKTGKPVQTGIMTVTVIGGSAAEDDAYTTAVMSMGKEGAVRFIKDSLSDREVVFTYDNGGSYEFYTNIPAGRYTVLDKNYAPKELK